MISERLLGEHTGLRISSMALGTARLGTAPGRTGDEGEALSAMRAFAEAGGTFIDSASAYQGGRAEEMVGAFLKEAGRDAFVISTKYTRTTQATPPAAAAGNHRRAMQREVEGSLRRLGTDRIELYFAHFDDGVTPVEELMRGLEDLARAGKIIHAGLSNFPAWRTASAAMLAGERGWLPVSALQLQYNLLERSIEREQLPLATARGMAVMAWSPLAGGKLGKTAAHEQASPTANIERVLQEIAGELNVAPAACALAWTLAKGTIPVLGPRTKEQLLTGLAAAEIRLAPHQLQRLDEASQIALGYPYDLLAQQRVATQRIEPRAGSIL